MMKRAALARDMGTTGRHGVQIVISVISLLTSGCVFPYHFTTRMGAAGFVQDALTGRPLLGAKVVLTDRNSTASTNTDARGHFLISPLRFWGIFIVPEDPGGIESRVTIEHQGYAPSRWIVTGNTMYEGSQTVEDLGVVRLRRVGR